MKDIDNTEDIALLVDSFYKRVLQDDVISHLFTTVVKLDWEIHIPIMNRFWNTVLLGSGTYSGQPMKVHMALNSKSPLHEKHFERWLALWSETVSSLFEGDRAERAKNQAKMMAHLIQQKIELSKRPGFIQ